MTISSRALQVRAQTAAGVPPPGASPKNSYPHNTPGGSRTVLVASKNPVKINAVQRALQHCFPSLQLTVLGREVPSGVPDQPRGDQETLAGARNRVAVLRSSPAAFPTAVAASFPHVAASPGPEGPSRGGAGDADAGDLLVAIEGGVGPAESPGQAGALECFAWVCVLDPHTGAESTARSASFALPAPLSDLILHQGMELGDADDAVFGRVRSKRGSGTIGRLSNGVLDRTEYYVQATMCALLPYMQPQLYANAEYGRFMSERGEPSTL